MVRALPCADGGGGLRAGVLPDDAQCMVEATMSYGCQKDFHIEDYQRTFRRTSPVTRRLDKYGEPDALTPVERDELLLCGALGLGGESGEVIELVKKHRFQGKPIDLDKLKDEIGDVLWYLACLAEACDTDLGGCAERNRVKLLKRYPTGFELGGGKR